MLLSGLLAAVVAVSAPAASGSSAPHLTTTRGGALLMTWMEPAGGKKHALKLATMKNGKWSAARTIAARDDFFVNWADFPSIVEDAKGTLFAHWLQKSAPGTYTYDVVVTSSRDGGATWTPARVLHTDGTKTEHGFASMVPLATSGVGVVWLDGREMSPGDHGHGGGPMTMRYAELDAALKVTKETRVDARVCECCTTGMAMTANGPVIAYRDRSESEVRDIGILRRANGTWTAPKLVHNDGWKIAGCPVNGPQLDARGKLVAAAWFTAANNDPRVYVAFSRDAGATFGPPVRVDSGKSIGRVEVLLANDGSALVMWVENDDIMLRRVPANGKPAAPVKVAATTAARGSGFPRAALLGNTVYVAWTDATAKRVKLTRVD
ncbi:MAG TPA: sialidase family protein [Thermoanaerobaculia bacterium]|nr:sialidase family protein [Thermoanaerobaculia bacterium]